MVDGVADTEIVTQRGPDRGKERKTSLEGRAIGSLLRGFSEVRRWAQTRDRARLGDISNLTEHMETVADLMVTERRGTILPHKRGELEELIGMLDKELPVSEGAEAAVPLPYDTEALLSHVEAFPLAVHDLRNRLTSVRGYGDFFIQHANNPEFTPQMRDTYSQSLASAWHDVESIAHESIDFLTDPSSTTQEISLVRVNNIVSRVVTAQQKLLETLPIRFVELSVEESGLRSIKFSPFLLRSIVANASQNTLRAARRRQDHPELLVSLSMISDDATGAESVVLELHDNAGGFPNTGQTGYSDPESNAMSRGIALKSLDSLIAQAGGIVERENIPYGNTEVIGAQTKISFPVISQAAD